MPMLEEMAGRFPGVKIVIDHLGKPDLKQADPWTDFRKNVPAETLSPGLGERVVTV